MYIYIYIITYIKSYILYIYIIIYAGELFLSELPVASPAKAATAGLPCTMLPRVNLWKPVVFCWTTARRWSWQR